MNVLQVGLGEFGMSWFKDIISRRDDIKKIILVDIDEEALLRAKVHDKRNICSFYNNFKDGLKESPDIILNITPPHLHKTIIEESLCAGIPVLSEKPITHTREDALAILELSEKSNIPIMIAENYRFSSMATTVNELILNDEIGKIEKVTILFSKSHHMENYHKFLEHPLLLDVAVHHMDLLRFFTNEEMVSVYGNAYNPVWSWYKGMANADAIIEMTNGVRALYSGSMVSRFEETSWNGNWNIEGVNGKIDIKDDVIYLVNENGEKTIKVKEKTDSRLHVFTEFIVSLNKKRPAQTDIRDNIKSFQIVASIMEG